MACHAVSPTTAWWVALKARPWWWLSTLDPLRISTITLYSSHPGHKTLLTLNSGGVVLPTRFSNSLSLPVGIRASFSEVLISSVMRYSFSSKSLKGVLSSSSSSASSLPSSSSSSFSSSSWSSSWLSFCVFSRRYRDYYIKVVLLLRNIMRRVGLWLRLRWHIP
jgi:hypothetical protein